MKPTIVEEIQDSEGNVVQPFTPALRWDITKTPEIKTFDANNLETGIKTTVDPKWVQLVKEGMREVVVNGTSAAEFDGFAIPSGGKTGTEEYCDNVAQDKH